MNIKEIVKEEKSFTDKNTNKEVKYTKLYLITEKGVKIAIKGNDPTASELLISVARKL